MSETNLQSVALFPIPDCVVFPGMVFPLHVFEPRYRRMIAQCIKQKIPVAICHTQKTLHEATPAESTEEALNSNQATYKPYPIFSAGLCELVDRLEDGRLLVNVYIDRRLELVEETQTLPFQIAKCKPYLDSLLTQDQTLEAEQLKDKIMHRLVAFSAGNQDVISRLESAQWQDKSAESFSFEMFSIFKLESELQQSLLEDRCALSRLKKVLITINEN